MCFVQNWANQNANVLSGQEWANLKHKIESPGVSTNSVHENDEIILANLLAICIVQNTTITEKTRGTSLAYFGLLIINMWIHVFDSKFRIHFIQWLRSTSLNPIWKHKMTELGCCCTMKLSEDPLVYGLVSDTFRKNEGGWPELCVHCSNSRVSISNFKP